MADPQAAQDAVAAQWHDKLDRVRIRVPPQGQRMVDTLRTALAHMLISRTGPRLQPGTRSYARAWIRDGAMIVEGAVAARARRRGASEFLRWYAPIPVRQRQGAVLRRRSRQPIRCRRTTATASSSTRSPSCIATRRIARCSKRCGRTSPARCATWTSCARASAPKPTAAANPAFYGLMPASISHEGYSAKPMHSYWDDFWALRGYKDAVAHRAMARARPTMRRASRPRATSSATTCMHRSRSRTAQKGIDFIPGLGRTGRLRCDLDHDRAGAGRRTGAPAGGAVARHLRALLEGVRRAPRRPARMEGLHAVRVAHRRQLRAPGLARTRARRCSISSSPTSSRAAGTSGPKSCRARRASRSSSATCRMRGWRRITCARRSTCSPMPATMTTHW